MPSALDAYPLGQHYIDRSLRDERHVRASGNTPAEREHTNQHIRAASGVTGKLNVNGDLQVKNLGKMRAGQTAYDTGIGWFFGYNGNIPVFSIGDSSPGANKMLWDGTDLTIVGDLSATTGEIGGWSIGTSQLTGGNAALDSSGFLELGTGDDIAKLSAVDATYRLWVGNANPGDAPFSVQKNGNFFAGDTTLTDDYVQWDGSTLTVKGRIEFGTGDFLDNDVLHFQLANVITEFIELEAFDGTATHGGGFRGRTNSGLALLQERMFDERGAQALSTEIESVANSGDDFVRVALRATRGASILAEIQAFADSTGEGTIDFDSNNVTFEADDIDIGDSTTSTIDLQATAIALDGKVTFNDAPVLNTGTGDVFELNPELFTTVGTAWRDIQVLVNGTDTAYIRLYQH